MGGGVFRFGTWIRVLVCIEGELAACRVASVDLAGGIQCRRGVGTSDGGGGAVGVVAGGGAEPGMGDCVVGSGSAHGLALDARAVGCLEEVLALRAAVVAADPVGDAAVDQELIDDCAFVFYAANTFVVDSGLEASDGEDEKSIADRAGFDRHG